MVLKLYIYLFTIIELVIKMHHYWITKNLWSMITRIFFLYVMAFIYLILILFLINRFVHFGTEYNMFYEKRILGIEL